MTKKNILQVLAVLVMSTILVAPFMEARHGHHWRRRHYHSRRWHRPRHRSYWVAPLFGGLATAALINASRSSGDSSVRSDLNNTINAVNAHTKNLEEMNKVMKEVSENDKEVNDKLNKLAEDIKNLLDEIKEVKEAMK